MMKKIFLITSFICVFISNAQKTAFISETKLLEATPGYSEAIKEMDSLQTLFAKEIKDDQKKLSQKIITLLAPYNLSNELTMDEAVTKLNEGDKKKMELFQEEAKLQDKQTKNKEEDFQALYSAKVGVILERVNNIIISYCKKNKIDILYKKEIMDSAMGYLNADLDITSQIIAKIK